LSLNRVAAAGGDDPAGIVNGYPGGSPATGATCVHTENQASQLAIGAPTEVAVVESVAEPAMKVVEVMVSDH